MHLDVKPENMMITGEDFRGKQMNLISRMMGSSWEKIGGALVADKPGTTKALKDHVGHLAFQDARLLRLPGSIVDFILEGSPGGLRTQFPYAIFAVFNRGVGRPNSQITYMFISLGRWQLSKCSKRFCILCVARLS